MKKITVALLACAALLAGCQSGLTSDPVVSRVEAAMKKDEFINKFDIKAKHDQGKVTLDGKVNNDFQKYHAGEVAKNVEGVKSVDNKIKVD